MTIKASGRLALVFAAGLLVCFVGSAPVTAASSDRSAAASKSDKAPSGKSVRQSTRRWKHYSRRPGKVASKPAETKKAAGKEVADSEAGSQTLPASVANANAQLAAAEPATGGARAMTEQANILLASADKPTDAEAVVASDQLNDIDRAVHQSPATPTVAMAAVKPAAAPPVMASGNDSSAWDQTSLIGKIFIAFGALLTMASAARMFMA